MRDCDRKAMARAASFLIRKQINSEPALSGEGDMKGNEDDGIVGAQAMTTDMQREAFEGWFSSADCETPANQELPAWEGWQAAVHYMTEQREKGE